MTKEAPSGEWESPITSELMTAKVVAVSSPSILADGTVLWVEMRPSEKGRQVVVKWSLDDGIVDVTPGVESGINARTRVHEYGGGDFGVGGDKVFFSNFSDQRVYSQELAQPGQEARGLTPEGSKVRFADYIYDAVHSRIIAVAEDHSGEGEPVNTVSAVDVSSGAITVLSSGRDFYHSPRLSPSGRRLAWIEWDHPNMPWDATQLWVADVADDGALTGKRLVAGDGRESVQQPVWGADDDTLYFVTDRAGWWNVFVDAGGEVSHVLDIAAEFGYPGWLHAYSSVALLPGGKLLVLVADPAQLGAQLAVLDPADGALTKLDTGFYGVNTRPKISVAQTPRGLSVALVGGSPTQSPQLMLLTVPGVEQLLSSSPVDWKVLRSTSDLEVDPGYLSVPSVIAYPSEGGRTAYMNYYPPTNKDFHLPAGQAPALHVTIHGGPTSAASPLLSMGVQYWTSRGFAVADVNYGGSTGFGTAFRNTLRGTWGVVDVEDCCSAAAYLAAAGLADPAKLTISGGSAGGFTAIASLIPGIFAAAGSHYGVTDLKLLTAHTHKFESRYLDGLVGPLPEAEKLYEERSPINHVDKIKAPLILFQGKEDAVVPPEQAEVLHSALLQAGVPTALVLFDGEQHGFRQARNVRTAVDGELYFMGRVLGFNAPMPPDLDTIPIDNLA